MPQTNLQTKNMGEREISFPSPFLWGTATSAYQIEGSIHVDGKSDSIWDVFCRQSGHILNHDTGEIACDHYRLWREDVQLMSSLGIKAYRFSISWPRIIPDGNGDVNHKGLKFYDNLIDELIHHGIEPVITLYHWDLPQSLQEKGGWGSRDTVKAFVNYALVCFAKFKDKVKWWITHNEPWVISCLGYREGIHAPGLRDSDLSIKASHHLLLSHGMAVKAMRKADPAFKGKIGISLNLNPIMPQNPCKKEDQLAAEERDLLLNRFYLDALFKGKYPIEVIKKFPVLRDIVQEDDLELISASIDFLGVNYYTRTLVNGRYVNDQLKSEIFEHPNDHSTMWEFYPDGIRKIIDFVWENYRPKEILITENGTALNDIVNNVGSVDDDKRIEYMAAHLLQLHGLIQKGVPITGYFAWSFLDNFEWAYGYAKRFGLVYVNFITQQRISKKSAEWFKNVCSSSTIPS